MWPNIGVENYSLKHLHGITMFVRAASCISAFRTKPQNSLSSTHYQRHLFLRHENMCKAAISVERSDTKYQSLYLLLLQFCRIITQLSGTPNKGLLVNFGQVSLLLYVNGKVACKSSLNSTIPYYCILLHAIQVLTQYAIVRDTGDSVQQQLLRFDLSAWHTLLVFTKKLYQ